jgi:hypothetical protein
MPELLPEAVRPGYPTFDGEPEMVFTGGVVRFC